MIIKYPSKTLLEPTKAVTWPLPEGVRNHVQRLQMMLSVTPSGLAIASNQTLPEGWRLFVTRSGGAFGQGIIINPSYTPIGDERATEMEGCLSYPGLFYPVSRLQRVQLTYSDIDGIGHSVDCEGIDARVVQHECDHLDGVLFTERMADRFRTKAKLEFIKRRKAGRW